ncbi:AAA-like domain-containing protein [uncultured Acetatifactor sp.]|uniref:AAA-like domain-containing protein n=1 Tax=uncultured Acetatifactor sp. TaxID=1671927 RepID=UPI002629D3CB|nr:AAA-like domain-containing protein [uncultured Acetatifactor sp.]
MKYFNTEGQCNPDIHYMVNLDQRLKTIKERYIERGTYFIINRGRQYGKTTTLLLLADYLKTDYLVLFFDFQDLTTSVFQDESSFVKGIIRCFKGALEDYAVGSLDAKRKEEFLQILDGQYDMTEMFTRFSQICGMSKQPVILMIDEVDSASNNQVFIDFLALLRRYYLSRAKKPAFHSVVLAGVYDIKNLKLKMRPSEEQRYNSPWNIAAKFAMDMDFSAEQIAGMLRGYESDHQTGMPIEELAAELYRYTSGYPYLVSAICKTMDEELPEMQKFSDKRSIWTKEGIVEAVKIILKSKPPLFDSMTKQFDMYPDLRNMIEQILYQGRKIPFSPAEKSIDLGLMFGFLKDENGYVAVANRIFEMYLLDLFIAEEAVTSDMYFYSQGSKNQFITGNRLDMELVLAKFVEHFTDIYGDNDEKFIEAYGRKFFLLYLKPIINGTGNYYVEAQTRDAKRTDVIVDYLGEQLVVELKIWHGNEYNERGEKQLLEYLDYFRQEKGYMLSFNFNKKKTVGMKRIRIEDRTIVEAVV